LNIEYRIMDNCKLYVNHNINKGIPIEKKSPTNMKDDFLKNEYSLKQGFFDPSKSSPPNEFMLKLQLRMSHYNNSNSLIKE